MRRCRNCIRLLRVLLLAALGLEFISCSTTGSAWKGGKLKVCEKCYSARFQTEKGIVASPAKAVFYRSDEQDSEIRTDSIYKRLVDEIAPRVVSHRLRISGRTNIVDDTSGDTTDISDELFMTTIATRIPAGLEKNICPFGDHWVFAITEQDVDAIKAGSSYILDVRNDPLGFVDRTVESVLNEATLRRISVRPLASPDVVRIEIALPQRNIAVTDSSNTDPSNTTFHQFISSDCSDRSGAKGLEAIGCIGRFRASYDKAGTNASTSQQSSDGACVGIFMRITKKDVELQRECISLDRLQYIYGLGSTREEALERLYMNIGLAAVANRSEILTDLMNRTDGATFRRVDCSSLTFNDPDLAPPKKVPIKKVPIKKRDKDTGTYRDNPDNLDSNYRIPEGTEMRPAKQPTAGDRSGNPTTGSVNPLEGTPFDVQPDDAGDDAQKSEESATDEAARDDEAGPADVEDSLPMIEIAPATDAQTPPTADEPVSDTDSTGNEDDSSDQE